MHICIFSAKFKDASLILFFYSFIYECFILFNLGSLIHLAFEIMYFCNLKQEL